MSAKWYRIETNEKPMVHKIEAFSDEQAEWFFKRRMNEIVKKDSRIKKGTLTSCILVDSKTGKKLMSAVFKKNKVGAWWASFEGTEES